MARKNTARFTAADVTVEMHPVDGFTLWWTDPYSGCLSHRRFIDYTVEEATALCVADLAGSL